MAAKGRGRIEIDWQKFDDYCAYQCTLREIADTFDCSERTIERKVKEHYNCRFVDIFKRKRQTGLISLRQNLFKQSEKNPAVVIFLAKNWLGMTDKQEIEHSGEAGKPIEVKHVSFDADKVAGAIIEAMRLGISPVLLGGNGHGQEADVLPARADTQATTVSKSKN